LYLPEDQYGIEELLARRLLADAVISISFLHPVAGTRIQIQMLRLSPDGIVFASSISIGINSSGTSTAIVEYTVHVDDV